MILRSGVRLSSHLSKEPVRFVVLDEAARAPHVAILSETTAGRCHHGGDQRALQRWKHRGLMWSALLAPPVHPEDAQGAFSCCRGDGSFESHRNRVGFVGEPRVIRVGFVSAARGNRVGAAWERRWIQGESALDPCHLRVRSRRYHRKRRVAGHKITCEVYYGELGS